jgi:hypothetical protein
VVDKTVFVSTTVAVVDGPVAAVVVAEAELELCHYVL